MRTASDRLATNLLVRLRETNDLDEALKMINDSALLLGVVRREDSTASSASGSMSGGSIGDGANGFEFDRERDKCEVMRITNLLAVNDVEMLDPKLRGL